MQRLAAAFPVPWQAQSAGSRSGRWRGLTLTKAVRGLAPHAGMSADPLHLGLYRSTGSSAGKVTTGTYPSGAAVSYSYALRASAGLRRIARCEVVGRENAPSPSPKRGCEAGRPGLRQLAP
jgi:hypothetical protein